MKEHVLGTGGQIVLRKATLSDLPEIQSLFVQTILVSCNKEYNGQQLDAWASSVNNLSAWQDKINTQIFLIAQSQEKIVGFGSLDKKNHLDMMYVNPDYQRLGIASSLMRELETEAKKTGEESLFSHASKTALPFFKRMGFQLIEEQHNIRDRIEILNYKMKKELKY